MGFEGWELKSACTNARCWLENSSLTAPSTRVNTIEGLSFGKGLSGRYLPASTAATSDLPTAHAGTKKVTYFGLLGVPGGSWDLVSTVISTLSGAISNYKYSYLNYNPSY